MKDLQNFNSPKSVSFLQHPCDLNTGIVLGILKQQGNDDDGIIKPEDVQWKTLLLILFHNQNPKHKV